MVPENKTRLNLYLSKDIVEFAKKWSYVTNVSISRMLEEYLKDQQNIVSTKTPFQWISDTTFALPPSEGDRELEDLEEYLDNLEEKDFCEKNPDHPRAKMRQKISVEYDMLFRELRIKKKKQEKELIERWMEVFR